MNQLKDKTAQLRQSDPEHQENKEKTFFGYKLLCERNFYKSYDEIEDQTIKKSYLSFLITNKVLEKATLQSLTDSSLESLILSLQSCLISAKCQELCSDQTLPDILVFDACEQIN